MTTSQPTFSALADWLAATSLSQSIQSLSWLIPLLQTIHIVALAIVLSSIGMISLRILRGTARRSTLADTAARHVPWIWGALLTMLLTGVTLVIGEPGRSLANAVFQWKMGLLLLGVLLVRAFRRMVVRNASFGASHDATRPAAVSLALLACALFVTMAVLGRWIAYTV